MEKGNTEERNKTDGRKKERKVRITYMRTEARRRKRRSD